MIEDISLLSKLQAQFGGIVRRNYLLTTCPQCGKDDHFYVYVNPANKVHSTCYHCGYGLSYKKLLAIKGKSNHNYIKDYHTTHGSNEFQLPKVILPDDVKFFKAKKYLLSRGLTEEDIFRWNLTLGCDYPWKDRVIFYYHNDQGIVTFYGGRHIDDNRKPRYLYPEIAKTSVLFNMDNTNPEYNFVVIMEGFFDVICSKITNAIALLGKMMSTEQEKIIVSKFKNFIIWLDPDAFEEAAKISERLSKWGNTYIVNQKQGKDPATCPNINYELQNMVLVTPKFFVEKFIEQKHKNLTIVQAIEDLYEYKKGWCNYGLQKT